MKYLLDLERTIRSGRTTFWKPSELGYTQELREAGKYDPDHAQHIAANDFDDQTLIIDEKVVNRIFQ